MSHQTITGALVKLNIDTKQAYALDAVLGIMQAGFQAAKEAGELERMAATKNFEEKFLSLLAIDVFLTVVTDQFNELDEKALPRDDDGKPYAEIEVETDDFTALAIYNLCGFAEDKYEFLKEFENAAPGLKFGNLKPLLAQTIKLLDIKPQDRVGRTTFQAPPKKTDFLN